MSTDPNQEVRDKMKKLGDAAASDLARHGVDFMGMTPAERKKLIAAEKRREKGK